MNYSENEKNYTGIWPFEKYSIEDIIEVGEYISNNKIFPDSTCSKKYQELQEIAGQYIAYIGTQLENEKDKERCFKAIIAKQTSFIDKIRNNEKNLEEDTFYLFRKIFILNMLERVTTGGHRKTIKIRSIPELDMTDCEEIKRKPESELTESEKRKMKILYGGVLEVLINEIYEKYKKIIEEEEKENQKILEKKKEEVVYV